MGLEMSQYWPHLTCSVCEKCIYVASFSVIIFPRHIHVISSIQPRCTRNRSCKFSVLQFQSIRSTYHVLQSCFTRSKCILCSGTVFFVRMIFFRLTDRILCVLMSCGNRVSKVGVDNGLWRGRKDGNTCGRSI